MPVNGSGDQWGWTEMEELLQCPVCFESPKGIVEQCKSGHHICADCKSKVDNCPLCKCYYTGTRNFVVEEIMRNFETLKNTMLLNALASESNKKKAKRKKVKTPAKAPAPKPSLPSTPIATKGDYPCVFRSCNVILPVSRMLNHARSFHSKFYCEGSLNMEGTFTVTFSLCSTTTFPLYKWQKVIFINGIGLVFFTYLLLKNDYLIATVQMVANQQAAQKFKCTLNLKNIRGADYKEVMKLVSSREKMENLLYGNECMLLNKRQTKSLRQHTTVNCTLEFSAVKEGDYIGSYYLRLGKPYLQEILTYYKRHDRNNLLPSNSVDFNVAL